ncbi:hypothetical protein [endosymbiont DhMRE of Dentiscutata heterogama]|uniref:hypothetical protein n=1 Tax=endosymbiont DhMRE of Dentiscutata heterogama TaxID=1609546 RepID=UPI002AD4C586|nr:hypothetical protein [endosymbiont DhMRE of Dentiscutata heterogama]
MIKAILAISLTANFFLVGLVIILTFKECRECGKEKNISEMFCFRCSKCKEKKNNGGNGNGKPKKVVNIPL